MSEEKEHECNFVEEQEPSGRHILGPCLECGYKAADALKQLKEQSDLWFRQIEPFRQQIKSLESRLKQSESELEAVVKERDLYNKNYLALESRLKEAVSKGENLCTAHGLLLCAHDTLKKQFAEAEQRLSQAEADSKLDRENYVKLWKDYSNLMDVAGKMAGAIDGVLRMYKTKRCPQCETNLRNLEAIHGHPIAPQGLVAHPAHFGCECYLEKEAWQKAKLAIAEWDGIKDGGK